MWLDADVVVDRSPVPFVPPGGSRLPGTDLEPVGDVVVLGRLPSDRTVLRAIELGRPVPRVVYSPPPPLPTPGLSLSAVIAVATMLFAVAGCAATAVLAVVGA